MWKDIMHGLLWITLSGMKDIHKDSDLTTSTTTIILRGPQRIRSSTTQGSFTHEWSSLFVHFVVAICFHFRFSIGWAFALMVTKICCNKSLRHIRWIVSYHWIYFTYKLMSHWGINICCILIQVLCYLIGKTQKITSTKLNRPNRRNIDKFWRATYYIASWLDSH